MATSVLQEGLPGAMKEPLTDPGAEPTLLVHHIPSPGNLNNDNRKLEPKNHGRYRHRAPEISVDPRCHGLRAAQAPACGCLFSAPFNLGTIHPVILLWWHNLTRVCFHGVHTALL